MFYVAALTIPAPLKPQHSLGIHHIRPGQTRALGSVAPVPSMSLRIPKRDESLLSLLFLVWDTVSSRHLATTNHASQYNHGGDVWQHQQEF